MDLHELQLDLERREGKAKKKEETALVKVEEKSGDVTKDTVVEVILEEDDDDRDFESGDAGLEETLTDAISLLQDCNNLLIALGNPLIHRQITYYMQQEIVRVTGETSMFLDGLKGLVEAPTEPLKNDWVEGEAYGLYD